MPRIEKSSELGFCFGVKQAIETLEKSRLKSGSGKVEMLGALVHNPLVVQRLTGKGISVIQSVAEAEGDVVAISAHGVGPQVLEEIDARKLKMIDTTCPLVRRPQRAARELAEAGFYVVVFGEKDHPEVKGILGWAGGKGIAILDAEQLKKEVGRVPRKLGVVAQTTQIPALFTEFVQKLSALVLSEVAELRVVNTICRVTRKRQSEALRLARKTDLMIVVGGRTSANTRRLADLCSAYGVETHLVETAAELEAKWLRGKECVGLVSGTSTPAEVTDDVLKRLNEMAGLS
ncbi:MAG: 4-hydroxy-3-methylbut-2-enyl diphosphate reductase [Dehalococcoidia bacterium]|nr:4-hydroxy-3-methylbut-2-enyl diphosphate reductase [Dehalococcoidia bacterium]